jgi:hypothetical protein
MIGSSAVTRPRSNVQLYEESGILSALAQTAVLVSLTDALDFSEIKHLGAVFSGQIHEDGWGVKVEWRYIGFHGRYSPREP